MTGFTCLFFGVLLVSALVGMVKIRSQERRESARARDAGITALCCLLVAGSVAIGTEGFAGAMPTRVDLPPSVLLANLSPPPGIVEMLTRDEGLRLKLYRDSRGNWTVGYGRNLAARGISQTEALVLLQNDILDCQADLDEHLAWWRLLSAPRQLAMLSLCYNLGIHGLKKFSRALGSMESGDYKNAAQHFMDSAWARQVGSRARQITRMIETNEVVK